MRTTTRRFRPEPGRDQALAQELWQSDVYDAKVLGLLIDDPTQMSREQAEKQVEQLTPAGNPG